MIHYVRCTLHIVKASKVHKSMSFQEKRTLVSLITTLVISAAYFVYMFQRYPEASPYSVDIFRYWGSFFLILIPVSIVAKVVVHIVFSIINTLATQEEEPAFTDERDRFIELKSARNALYTFSIGVVLAMGSLVIDVPPATMFLLLLGAGILSEVVSDISQLYFYGRGV
jgi:hypothetical protein